MTTNDLDQARKWAKDPSYQGDVPSVAAAHVIASLPDEWIDAAKLREVIEGWRTTTNQTMHRVDKTYKSAAADIEALLPTPKPRTLADMTHEEREACRWMQADYDDGFTEHPVRAIITVTYPNVVDILLPNGTRNCVRNEEITPLPDLPRMAWPEEQATEETPEVEEGIYGQALWDMFTKAIRDEKEYHIDAQDYEGGKRWLDAERALRTALETNPLKETPVPNGPEDAPDGYYLVRWWGEEHPVPAEKVQGQWWVIGKPTMLPAKDVLIVSRLVPEQGGVS